MDLDEVISYKIFALKCRESIINHILENINDVDIFSKAKISENMTIRVDLKSKEPFTKFIGYGWDFAWKCGIALDNRGFYIIDERHGLVCGKYEFRILHQGIYNSLANQIGVESALQTFIKNTAKEIGDDMGLLDGDSQMNERRISAENPNPISFTESKPIKDEFLDDLEYFVQQMRKNGVNKTKLTQIQQLIETHELMQKRERGLGIIG